MITVVFANPTIASGQLSEKDLVLKGIMERTLAARVENLDCPAHGTSRWLSITVYGDFAAHDFTCDVEGCCGDFVERAELALDS